MLPHQHCVYELETEKFASLSYTPIVPCIEILYVYCHGFKAAVAADSNGGGHATDMPSFLKNSGGALGLLAIENDVAFTFFAQPFLWL